MSMSNDNMFVNIHQRKLIFTPTASLKSMWLQGPVFSMSSSCVWLQTTTKKSSICSCCKDYKSELWRWQRSRRHNVAGNPEIKEGGVRWLLIISESATVVAVSISMATKLKIFTYLPIVALVQNKLPPRLLSNIQESKLLSRLRAAKKFYYMKKCIYLTISEILTFPFFLLLD